MILAVTPDMLSIDSLQSKFEALDSAAQWILIAAGSAVLLLLVLLLVLLVSAFRGRETAERVKIPKQLPMVPQMIHDPRSARSAEVISAAVSKFRGFDFLTKVAPAAVLGPREGEHHKIVQAIYRNMSHVPIDGVVVDQLSFPRVVLCWNFPLPKQLNEYFYRAGIPVISLTTRDITREHVEEQLRKVLR